MVSKCTIASSSGGDIVSCAATGSGFTFNGPLDFAFSGTWAYITNAGTSGVIQCNVTAGTGSFTGCATAVSGLTGNAYGV